MDRFALVLLFVAGCSSSGSTLVADDEHALFDTVLGRASSQRTFTFTNGGGSTTPSLTTELLGDVDVFRLGDDSCAAHHIPAGTSCLVTVQLTGERAGSFDGELHVSGGAFPAASVLLSGKVAPADLVIQPIGSVQAEVVQGGDLPAPAILLTVQNLGGAKTGGLDVGDVTPFTTSSDCEGMRLGGGDHCSVRVTLPPQPLDAPPGAHTHTLTVTDGSGVAGTIDLVARIDAVGKLEVGNADLGAVAPNTLVGGSLTVRDPAPIYTGGLQASLVEDASNPATGVFTVDINSCYAGLNANGDTCTVSVSATPRLVGSYGATVTVSGAHIHSGSARVVVSAHN